MNYNNEYISQEEQEIVICSVNEELYRVNPVEEECPQYACSECLAALHCLLSCIELFDNIDLESYFVMYHYFPVKNF